MTPQIVARKHTYAGLFLVALATLMYEILLTRIFSVTMWYHFAFVAISVAMFGMTVGAIAVYLLPDRFTPERVKHHLGLTSLLLALSVVLSFLTHLSIPFVPDMSVVGVYSIALTYLVVAVPFVFSGVCVSLASLARVAASLAWCGGSLDPVNADVAHYLAAATSLASCALPCAPGPCLPWASSSSSIWSESWSSPWCDSGS